MIAGANVYPRRYRLIHAPGGRLMPRALLATALLAVVVVGGVAIGMIHAFSEEIGLDW